MVTSDVKTLVSGSGWGTSTVMQLGIALAICAWIIPDEPPKVTVNYNA